MFIASDERFLCWRQTVLALETNAFRARDDHISAGDECMCKFSIDVWIISGEGGCFFEPKRSVVEKGRGKISGGGIVVVLYGTQRESLQSQLSSKETQNDTGICRHTVTAATWELPRVYDR